MDIPEESTLLRIYLGESDRSGHQALYEAIVEKARENHLAGATVLRGSLGFGKSSHVHTAKILRLSMDLPIIIEIIDTEEKVSAFLPMLKGMMAGGLITTQPIKIVHCEAGPP
jgi:PII-like signaling protein